MFESSFLAVDGKNWSETIMLNILIGYSSLRFFLSLKPTMMIHLFVSFTFNFSPLVLFPVTNYC